MISGIFHFDELSQTSSPGHHVTCARSATFNNFWEACAIFHVCLRCHFFNQFPFLVRARLVQVSKVYDSLALSGNDNSAFLTLLHNSFMWQLRIEIRIYVLDAWILSVMYATLTDKVSSVHFADIFGFLASQPKYFVNMAFVRYRSETICCFCCSFFYLSPLLLATRQETFRTPVAHTTTEVQRKTEEITSACCISEKRTSCLARFVETLAMEFSVSPEKLHKCHPQTGTRLSAENIVLTVKHSGNTS